MLCRHGPNIIKSSIMVVLLMEPSYIEFVS